MTIHDIARLPDRLTGPLELLPPDEPFTAAQARTAGVGPSQLRALLKAGLLERPLRGVYRASSSTPDCLERRLAAIKQMVPPDCVVTDRTAAWLWGAPMVLAPGDHLVAPPVSVFAPPGRRLRNGVTASGERGLATADVTELGGVRVTTPLRTACDLGRLLHRDQALAAMDMLASLRHFSREELALELVRFKGYRGVIQARVLAQIVDGRSQSPMESILRLRWIDAGLPAPECQVEIEAPQGSFFLDVGSRKHRFAAEYDGAEFHTDADAAHDSSRREWARSPAGGDWFVYVARKENVIGRHQDAEHELRRLFALHRR